MKSYRIRYSSMVLHEVHMSGYPGIQVRQGSLHSNSNYKPPLTVSIEYWVVLSVYVVICQLLVRTGSLTRIF